MTNSRGLPWWSSSWEAALPMQEVCIRSLTREPDPACCTWRSHMPQQRPRVLGAATKIQHRQKKKNNNNFLMTNIRKFSILGICKLWPYIIWWVFNTDNISSCVKLKCILKNGPKWTRIKTQTGQTESNTFKSSPQKVCNQPMTVKGVKCRMVIFLGGSQV